MKSKILNRPHNDHVLAWLFVRMEALPRLERLPLAVLIGQELDRRLEEPGWIH